MGLGKNFRKQVQKETLLGSVFKTTYLIFGHQFTQAIISVSFTICIGVLINIHSTQIQNDVNATTLASESVSVESSPDDFESSSTIDRKNGYIYEIIIVSIAYLFLQLLIILSLAYNRKKQSDILWYNKTVSEHNTVNSNHAKFLFTLSDRTIRGSALLSIDTIKDNVGYKHRAFNICDAIYDTIERLKGCSGCNVTIFQQFEDSDGSFYIQKVAYRYPLAQPPGNIREKYVLFDSSVTEENKRYSVRIFEKKISKIYVLNGNDEIKKNFFVDDYSLESVNKMRQYVGIPILDMEGRIVLLLQIDVNESNILGDDEAEIIELVNNIFILYAHLLNAMYEQERFLVTMYNHLRKDNIHGTIEETPMEEPVLEQEQ